MKGLALGASMRWYEHQTTAVTLFAVAMMAIALNDALIKLISPSVGLAQFMLLRSVVASAVFLSLPQTRRDLAALDRQGWLFLSLRGFALTTAMSLYFTSLIIMPMANAMALFFTAPIFITLGSVLLFGERLTAFRLIALVMGLVGTWLILPSFELALSLGGTLLGLASALCYASFQLLTRGIRSRGTTLAMSTIQTLAYVVLAGGWLAITSLRPDLFPTGEGMLDFLVRGWTWLTWQQVGILAICTLAMLALSLAGPNAYRNVEASAMAPFEFAALGAGIFFGIVILGEWPSLAAYTGAALIAAAGILMVQRAQAREQAK